MPSAQLWLTEADLAEAARLHRSLRQGHRYGLDLLATAPFVWFIALVPFFLSEVLVVSSAFVGAMLGAGIYLAWRLWRLLPWRRGRKAITSGFQEIVWSEHSISTTTRLGTTSYRWASLAQWTEEDGMVLLYRDIRTFQILPRRTFASFTEIVQVENYLTAAGVRRVGPKRRTPS